MFDHRLTIRDNRRFVVFKHLHFAGFHGSLYVAGQHCQKTSLTRVNPFKLGAIQRCSLDGVCRKWFAVDIHFAESLIHEQEGIVRT